MQVGIPQPPLTSTARPFLPNRTDYARTVRELSERLVDVQRPIRVLDAMRWDCSIQQQFFADQFQKLPRIDSNSYRKSRLGYEPRRKQLELQELQRDIRRKLPTDDPAGRLLADRCRQYRDAVGLVEARGTLEFAPRCRRIFGSTLRPQQQRASLDRVIRFLETRLQSYRAGHDEKIFSAEEAGIQLRDGLRTYFGGDVVKVKVVDALVSDASAGADYLKLRRGARFSARDIRLLEVHETWVHLGTTINGRGQPILTCLSKAAPGTTRSQEGLAVLTEFLSGADHPGRVQRLLLRLRGLMMAEQGADFLEVFRFFSSHGNSHTESYHQTARLFRGSLPSTVGPFTKDLAYATGLWTMTRHLRSALRGASWSTIELLFCGKTAVEELPTLSELREAGWIAAPEFVPPPFRDRTKLENALEGLELL